MIVLIICSGLFRYFARIALFTRENRYFIIEMFSQQISDIHISIFHDEQRIDNFEQFVTETLNTIKPPVVLASGDLTDARDVDFIGARQYVREWQIYNDILARTNVKNRTLWMDIKGNHGMCSVPSNQSTLNLIFSHFLCCR